jgi:hypothetical protein
MDNLHRIIPRPNFNILTLLGAFVTAPRCVDFKLLFLFALLHPFALPVLLHLACIQSLYL